MPQGRKMEKVNKPSHYGIGEIEPIDYMKDQLSDEEFRGYIKGNILKYVSRERLKNRDEDLRKASYYLNYLLCGVKADTISLTKQMKEEDCK